jgi:hypothetical protein
MQYHDEAGLFLLESVEQSPRKRTVSVRGKRIRPGVNENVIVRGLLGGAEGWSRFSGGWRNRQRHT